MSRKKLNCQSVIAGETRLIAFIFQFFTEDNDYWRLESDFHYSRHFVVEVKVLRSARAVFILTAMFFPFIRRHNQLTISRVDGSGARWNPNHQHLTIASSYCCCCTETSLLLEANLQIGNSQFSLNNFVANFIYNHRCVSLDVSTFWNTLRLELSRSLIT